MRYPFHEELDCSHNRKVFAVGDIHGHFDKLEEGLSMLGFDPKTDILISVGDLVDRGPHSEQFVHYITQPWFKRVLGNHDLIPNEYLLGYESPQSCRRNGCGWWMSKSNEEIAAIARLLEDAPLAITAITPAGRRVGITHADAHKDWNGLIKRCSDRKRERILVDFLTGSRETIRNILENKSFHDAEVKNIDHVFHGHTPLRVPLNVGNRTFIDTGAGNGKTLTIIDIDDWITSRS